MQNQDEQPAHALSRPGTMEVIAPGIVLFTCDEDVTIEFERGNLSFHIVTRSKGPHLRRNASRFGVGWVSLGPIRLPLWGILARLCGSPTHRLRRTGTQGGLSRVGS